MDGVGAKMVCSECYHVTDLGAAPAGGQSAAPQAAAPKFDPNAPLPTFSQAPTAALTPGICPKCSGQTSDVGGRLVCSQCYWVVDQGRATFSNTSQPVTSAGITVPQLGIVVTVIFVVIMVFMVNTLSKLPPGGGLNLGALHGPTTTGSPTALPGTPVQPTTSLPGTPVQPTTAQPALSGGFQTFPAANPAPTPAPVPQIIVPQGGLTNQGNPSP